jgi:hypothetical protein
MQRIDFLEFELDLKFEPFLYCDYKFEHSLDLAYIIRNILEHSDILLKDIYKKECEKLWPILTKKRRKFNK